MSERVELVRYGSGAPLYDHGPEHPLRPARVFLTYLLIDDYRIVDGDVVRSVDARSAADEELLLVHTERYLEAVKGAGSGTPGSWAMFGFGPGDNPVFPRMHEASAA